MCVTISDLIAGVILQVVVLVSQSVVFVREIIVYLLLSRNLSCCLEIH